MRDILPEVDRWRAAGEQIALATVIRTWGSSPRGVGSQMALTPDGKVTGSVSAGCVENAVFEVGQEVLQTGRPQRLHYGVADDTAWEVGLVCGGTIDVFVNPLRVAFYDAVRRELAADRAFAWATVTRGPGDLPGQQLLLREDGSVEGGLSELQSPVLEMARQALAEGESRLEALETEIGPVEVFVNVTRPAPELVAIGGVHISIALTRFAQTLGFRTTIVDPRGVFGSAARFPHVDRIVTDWPDDALRKIGLTASSAVAVVSHDPKLDDPALMVALPSPAFYVGGLGSLRTQEARRRRLLAAGITPEQLARLHGPIGLDLKARSPEEIALSIMAEIIAVRNRGRP